MNKLGLRIGRRLSYWRDKRGLTLEKFAYENDISKGYLSELEAGKKLPSLKMLEKIADALEIDIKDLF